MRYTGLPLLALKMDEKDHQALEKDPQETANQGGGGFIPATAWRTMLPQPECPWNLRKDKQALSHLDFDLAGDLGRRSKSTDLHNNEIIIHWCWLGY